MNVQEDRAFGGKHPRQTPTFFQSEQHHRSDLYLNV